MSHYEPIIRIAITLCFLALLVVVSIVPGVERSERSILIHLYIKTPRELQKAMHVCLYAVLTVLLLWVLNPVRPSILRYAIAFLGAVAFGAVMQWWQTRVPGRYGTLQDVALDASGATLAVACLALLS